MEQKPSPRTETGDPGSPRGARGGAGGGTQSEHSERAVPPPRYQEFKLDGGQVLDKVKDLIHQGNIRRIVLKNEEGRTLMEIPLTWGVVGAALLPVFAAVGALAAVATRMVIVVEKTEG